MQMGKHIGLFNCLKNGLISFKRNFPLKLNQVLVWSIWFGLFLICWNCCSGEQCELWSFCLCFLEHDPKTVRECPRSSDVQRGLPRRGPLAGRHGWTSRRLQWHMWWLAQHSGTHRRHQSNSFYLQIYFDIHLLLFSLILLIMIYLSRPSAQLYLVHQLQLHKSIIS